MKKKEQEQDFTYDDPKTSYIDDYRKPYKKETAKKKKKSIDGRYIPLLALIGAVAIVLIFFQNCGKI